MSDPIFPAEGSCACRRVRFRMISPPLFVHCCHCRWCQRETGSAFAINAMIEAQRVELLSGAPEPVLTPTESGKGQKVVRCPSCRVALWSHYAGMGEKFSFVRVGALDNPEAAPPDIHIYTASKQSWVIIPPGAAAVPEYYARRDYWPADSVARFERLRAA